MLEKIQKWTGGLEMIHSSTEGGCMPIHKWFTTEPVNPVRNSNGVKALLKGYCQEGVG